MVDVQIIHGFIITEALVDGQVGNYIFDSGAPGLVLSDSFSSKSTRSKKCHSISSELTCLETKVRHFEWNHISIKNVDALVMNLDHLSEAVGLEINGLLGTEIYSHEKILINYQNNELVFLPNIKTAKEKFIKDQAQQNFIIEMQGNLPVINYNLNGIAMKLGIDSGARSNIISKNIFAQIEKEDVIDSVPIELVGMDQNITLSQKVSIQNQTNQNQPEVYVLCDLSALEQSGYHLDGLVGPSFFKDASILLDFKEGKLYLYSPSK